MRLFVLTLIIAFGLACYALFVFIAAGLASFNDKCGSYFKRRKNGKR
jgi:hypothetical protein